MAHKRMINGNVWEDEFFLSLSIFNRLLWIGILTASADDQGRFADNAALIRSRVFPVDDIQLSEIEAGIKIFAEAGKIERYIVNDKKAIQILKWWEHQKPRWAGKSTLPSPEGWTDKERYHTTGNEIVTSGWGTKGGYIAGYTINEVKDEVKVNINDETETEAPLPFSSLRDAYLESSGNIIPGSKDVTESFQAMHNKGILAEDVRKAVYWLKAHNGRYDHPERIERSAEFAMSQRKHKKKKVIPKDIINPAMTEYETMLGKANE